MQDCQNFCQAISEIFEESGLHLENDTFCCGYEILSDSTHECFLYFSNATINIDQNDTTSEFFNTSSSFYNTTSNFSSFTYEYAEYYEEPEDTLINMDFVEQEFDYAVDYIASMFGGMTQDEFLFYVVLVLGFIGSTAMIILGALAEAA